LARLAGLPISTSHGIVRTLLERGYLYVTSRRKDLYPTRRLYDMAVRINNNDPYLERFDPVLESLRNTTQETVIVGKRQDDQIIYLAVHEGPQTIRYSSEAGSIKPLHSTSIGKALLSRLDDQALRAWAEARELPVVTGCTLTSTAALVADVAQGRSAGYFVTRGESVSDVFAVAVPVEINGDVLGVAVAGPKHRVEERISEIAARLLEAKRSIEGATR
jgi:DNA-binding IclR family transcriptional regulator